MRKKRGLSCTCPHLQQDSELTSLLLTVGTHRTQAGTGPHAQPNTVSVCRRPSPRTRRLLVQPRTGSKRA